MTGRMAALFTSRLFQWMIALAIGFLVGLNSRTILNADGAQNAEQNAAAAERRAEPTSAADLDRFSRGIRLLDPYRGKDAQGEFQMWEVAFCGLPTKQVIEDQEYYTAFPSTEYDVCQISIRDPIHSVIYTDAIPAPMFKHSQKPVFQLKARGNQIVPKGVRVAVVVMLKDSRNKNRPGWIEGDVIVVTM